MTGVARNRGSEVGGGITEGLQRDEETFGVMYMFIILMMPITSKYNMDSLKLFILKRYSFFF